MLLFSHWQRKQTYFAAVFKWNSTFAGKNILSRLVIYVGRIFTSSISVFLAFDLKILKHTIAVSLRGLVHTNLHIRMDAGWCLLCSSSEGRFLELLHYKAQIYFIYFLVFFVCFFLNVTKWHFFLNVTKWHSYHWDAAHCEKTPSF